jgi:hypothetical protein
MIRIYSFVILMALAGFVFIQTASAQDSEALDAAQAAVAEPVAVSADEPAQAPAPVASAPVGAPTPTVEPTILKQLKDHEPIPIRSSFDQAIDTSGNRTIEYDEIKEYIKSIRASLSKGGRYPTNTDILYHFDKNHDGYMDGGDVSALESHIR